MLAWPAAKTRASPAGKLGATPRRTRPAALPDPGVRRFVGPEKIPRPDLTRRATCPV
ncbi:MAG: hypothetical protein OEY27_04160 [Gammaproteobacteria bacterium]|nr:hypothetical protein [Gammaproteobacteria bacterium]